MDASATELAPGIHVIRVPIPNSPLGWTLVYVLEGDDGPVLVDTGWHHPEAESALRSGVAAAGFELADIVGVLVTHHHPDHHGLSGVVREESGCWIAMHPADQALVRRFRAYRGKERSHWKTRSDQMLVDVGATLDELAVLPSHDASADIELPVEADRDLVDGQLADVAGRRVRTLWTPGHSPGHCSFLLEDQSWLCSGDHVLPRITPHVGLYEPLEDLSDPLGDFLTSLDDMRGRGITRVLPAHRQPFDDLETRLDEIISHHDDRLAEVLTILGAGAATPWAVAQQLSWNVVWDEVPMEMRRVALGEASAHLRHLERRGDIEVAGTAPLAFRRLAVAA